jgi:tRNA modification GTPase
MGETIFAQATPPGRSGIAVIRVSGPAAFAAADTLAGIAPPDRRARLCRVRDPRDGSTLDQGIVLRFPRPESFTGEDVVEFQLHGGPAVCRSVLAALGRIADLRPAEAGEFTRRALLNGRLDLVQVEGLGDLLAAETSAQQRQAISLMDGALSRLADRWRDALVEALALIEATIDFSDEDLPEGAPESARLRLEPLAQEMALELDGSAVAERLRDGFEVALVGAPTAGKSTLLNTIARREAAIVSELPGTTRDVLEVQLDLDGLPVTVLDMAGIRGTEDAIENLGVERARLRAAAADVRVFLVEGSAGPDALGVLWREGDLVLRAKGDLPSAAQTPSVSGLTGKGVSEMLATVSKTLQDRVARAATLNRERQRLAVVRAQDQVRAALVCLDSGVAETEIVAEELRLGLRALDGLVGRVDVEAVLDVIFRSFCIGK